MTHGGVCRAIVADVLEVAPERIFRLDVGYARLTVIDWFGKEPVVRLVNGCSANLDLALAGTR